MSDNIVLSFTLLFGAVIALICAIYVSIGMRRKKQKRLEEELTD